MIRFERPDATRAAASLEDDLALANAPDGAVDCGFIAPLSLVATDAQPDTSAAPVSAPEPGPVGEFLEQFDVAAPGEFIAYHVGDLACDCEVGDGARDIRACKAIALGLFQDREAHLVQRRFGPHRYVYYAVKR